MTNAQLLLSVILLQQSLFGLLWLVAARLRLARQPARHWAAMAGLAAAGLSLILLRGQAPIWLTVAVANAFMIAAFIVLRRGIQRFVRCRPSDGEHVLVLSLAGASLFGAMVSGGGLLPAVLASAAAMSWTLLRAAGEVRQRLAAEFGDRAALWCAAPLAVLGCLFVVRGALAPVFPEVFALYIQRPGADGLAAGFIALGFALVLQMNLAALVLLRLVRRLQYQSDHDVLTGLLSRRPMEQLLHGEVQRQRRFGGHFSMLSIDIDHFKQINDRFGHAVGDAVLARVAQTLRAAARSVDSVARMGGEEFCVLLPGADLAGAEAVARRLLDSVRTLQHPGADPALQVTVSIGLAVFDAPAEPLQALQRRLDQALYGAKAAGRDRIHHAVPAETAISA
jgi:diguanylate cyclase (GGDEF)-like protein